jgi:gamma-glutamyltranspeptidase/glutathione hydrolase
MPVLAKNVVATSQPLAAQAGLSIMQKGGNAVDAAIGAAATLTVVEPNMNGIGGDCFAMVWDGQNLHGMNASGRSPAAWRPDYFSKYKEMPLLGWDAVTVPGVVSGWTALSEKFGNLAFETLFEPAVKYAHDGFLVSPMTAQAWKNAQERYKKFPEFALAFLPNGKAPAPGSRFSFKAQAKTLEQIARTKGNAFYKGDLAEKIAVHAKNTGGLMTTDDLAAHTIDWVEPISVDYRGLILHEIPPNGQGIGALITLGILDNWDLGAYPVDSADSIHIQLEAMKLAFADLYRYVADPGSMDIDYRQLIDPGYLSSRAKLIDLNKAQVPDYGTPGQGGTVYLCTADESGMMVSLIQSNYWGFGSGIVVPDTGIALHCRGGGFVLDKGHPNQVDGNKRPFHTIIPAFVTQDGKPVMSFGVMGAPMQPQGHVQMMVRLFDYAQNPQAACDAPRWHVLRNMEIALEPGFRPQVIDELKNRGHRVHQDHEARIFGGGQLIYKLDDGYCGASDPRKDGQAVGF